MMEKRKQDKRRARAKNNDEQKEKEEAKTRRREEREATKLRGQRQRGSDFQPIFGASTALRGHYVPVRL